ncbi:CBO0543 family protein [Bacillus pinisoli]|uniref:CBO0543 family protein n=1 Tax=Bacillus pinisoli TaxID=2901866 RepID=UPI001FF5FBBD|nr:CBO0543 family protein [Bacillus pinisoli]
MNIEYLMLYVIYSITFISLAFIPKNKWKEASIIFLFQQFITWVLGLLAVELCLIEYPVRELAEVNRTSFLFEFLTYPIISIFFCLYYPQKRSRWSKFTNISTFCTAIVIPEILFERYTNLISYIKWEWYISWLSIYVTLYGSWVFYRWYFKLASTSIK